MVCDIFLFQHILNSYTPAHIYIFVFSVHSHVFIWLFLWVVLLSVSCIYICYNTYKFQDPKNAFKAYLEPPKLYFSFMPCQLFFSG